MSLTPLQQQMLNAVKTAGDWVTQGQIAESIKRGELSALDVEKLESLYHTGFLAKRVQGDEPVYRALPVRRPRREVVLGVLREYFDGEWKSTADIAGVLSGTSELTRTDQTHFDELIAFGLVEQQGEGQYRSLPVNRS